MLLSEYESTKKNVTANTLRHAPMGLVWPTAILVGFFTAWPLLYAALTRGPHILINALLGDSYHYLAIARKANTFHIYTYDGVHVTNGFHPLWQYLMRGLFEVLNLQAHESQAIAVVMVALGAVTAGAILTTAAIIRMTGHRFLGLLVVPGVFYVTVGVHVGTLAIWSALDGMESALSVFFGGLFFFVMSKHVGRFANEKFDSVAACRALGLVLPFLILSRLDDVFMLPAAVLTIFFLAEPLGRRLIASVWIAGPSVLAVVVYVLYNKLTVGAFMPLSGGTKSGFVGFLSAYMTAAVHFTPVLDLKALLAKSPSDGPTVYLNSFRFVEVAYPLTAGFIGALAAWRYLRGRPLFFCIFSVCLYVIFKAGYNFINVHPWHQAGWYYIFIMICITVLGALCLERPWSLLKKIPIARNGIAAIYLGLILLAGSQFCAKIIYQSPDNEISRFWERHALIREQLVANGVHGVINVDDGITAFLLDLPTMHGFAFATDVEAQKSHKAGRMLSLAYSRGIDTIVGFGYMATDHPPRSDTEIRKYLKDSLAIETMFGEMDSFDFSLAYYDPVLRLPFIAFRPK